jgi:uncharacterized protein YbjT (DUF2867 family)
MRVGRQHAAIEAAVTAAGLPHTLLRPQSFMRNTLAAAPTVAAAGAISQPFGRAGLP